MKLFNANIEEMILVILFNEGRLPIADLINIINARKNKATKQGVYRVIRKLSREEKVVVYKSVVSLNDLWVFKLKSLIEKEHNNTSLIGNLTNLQEKEKISIIVKTLTHVDQIWSNIFLTIESETKKAIPLYLYNPRYWSILIREDTDKIHFKRLANKQRKTYFVFRGSAAADKRILRMVHTHYLQCAIDPNITSNEHIAVLGDYLIRVKLSNKDDRLIDDIFDSSEDLEIIKTRLYEMDGKTSGKIIIEKNKVKAREWEKRIGKSFF